MVGPITCSTPKPAARRGVIRTLVILVVAGGFALAAQAQKAGLALDIDKALALARQESAQLAVLDARRAKAEGARESSLQAFLPSVSAGAAWWRTDASVLDEVPVPELGVPPSIVLRDLGPVEAYTSNVQVEQPLVNIDAWHARAQAGHLVESATLALRRGERELDVAVIEAYYGVRTLQAREAAVDAALAAARRALRVAEAAHEEGLVSGLDVSRARAGVASRQSQSARVRGATAEAEAGLRELLGLDAATRLVLTDDVPPPPPVGSGIDWSSGVLEERYDVRAGSEALAAAESGVDKAQAAYLPRLNLLGRYQWADSDGPFLDNLDGWLVAVSVRWTPFTGMAQAGALDQARAERLEARARLTALRRQAAREVQALHARWDSAFAAWREGEAAVAAAETAQEDAERRYVEGVGTLTDLLQAQASLLQARVERTDDSYRALVAARRHALATGPGSSAPGYLP